MHQLVESWMAQAAGSINLVGLTTQDMKGATAPTNMNALDFSTIWQTVEGSSPDATADGYLILQSIGRAAQLRAQGILAAYILTTSASPTGGGTIVGGGQFGEAEQTAIIAIPSAGYRFTDWTGSTSNIDDPTKATS